MEPFIVPLEAVRQSDVAQVGGKAAALGILLAAGFPVPAGLCVTVSAFHLALAPYQAQIDDLLRHADLDSPASTESAADSLARLLEGLTVPPTVADALRTHLDTHLSGSIANLTPLAVRSSAIGEDGAQNSFAGQYVSVLGVQGEAKIQAALVKCWLSFYSAHALIAHAQAKREDRGEGMALLIQPLLEAECAGVSFSIDPVQRRRTHVVVNAAWGLGTGVVDGSVACDTTWVKSEYFTVDQREIVEKAEQIRLVQGKPQRVAVPDDQRSAACLAPVWLERVVYFAMAARKTVRPSPRGGMGRCRRPTLAAAKPAYYRAAAGTSAITPLSGTLER